jgi:hypothetical protein
LLDFKSCNNTVTHKHSPLLAVGPDWLDNLSEVAQSAVAAAILSALMQLVVSTITVNTGW